MKKEFLYKVLNQIISEMKNKIGRGDWLGGNINESTYIDKKFLDKVADQIVRETRYEYIEKKKDYNIYPPYESVHLFLPYRYITTIDVPLSDFVHHCNGVYGLNGHERDYVWNIYKHIIKDKIKNG